MQRYGIHLPLADYPYLSSRRLPRVCARFFVGNAILPSRTSSSVEFLPRGPWLRARQRLPAIAQLITLRVFCGSRTTSQGEEGAPDGQINDGGKQQPSLPSKQMLDTMRDTLMDPTTLSEAAHAAGKPELCTADELHYVSVPGTAWKLALWRYPPRPEARVRNHPILMLSGVGTNAIGFDLHPSVSMARHMAEQGFDTWILEVRGSGLSTREGQHPPAGQVANATDASVRGISKQLSEESEKLASGDMEASDKISEASHDDSKESPQSDSKVASSLSKLFSQVSETSRKMLNDGQSLLLSTPLLDRISRLLESFQLSDRYDELRENVVRAVNERQNSVIVKQMEALSNQLLKLLEDGQKIVSPQLSDLQDKLINARQLAELQDRLIVTLDDYQKLFDLLIIYDWDFDNYLEEDVPAAMEYIRNISKPKDGKMHAVGHSMGGIVLYALLASQKEQCGLVSAVTLASSLDYGVSNSSLKMLLPLADPAQVFNVPAVPLGALMAAVHPLAMNPPYFMSWLTPLVSAQDMMDSELFKKLVMNNFCTIPAKLLIHLTTVFQPGGLRNRTGTMLYKDHLHMCTTPVLAIAGDEDFICPPAAVEDTVKHIPESLVTYKLFGGPGSHHYGHYDLVCARMAKEEVYPCIQDFLASNDGFKDPAST